MTLPQISERSSMDMESCVPPGFRFHPTEEELVGYYLKRKINSLKIDLDVIVEIDLYKMEPWDIQDRCKLGYEQQNEWYFFSHKDKKYPTGTRTNRATAAGFWKATGRDKAVMSKNRIIGMRKTLVFYKGRAPNGRKTDWIMHEYRHQTSEHGPPQEEGWVVCRAFKKPSPSHRQGFDPWFSSTNHHQASHLFRSEQSSYARPLSISDILNESQQVLVSDQAATTTSFMEQQQQQQQQQQFLCNQQSAIIDLPQLDSPTAIKEDYCDETNWKCFDNLFDDTSSSSYFSNPNFPINLVMNNNTHDHHLQPLQNQPSMHHVLGCFPNHDS